MIFHFARHTDKVRVGQTDSGGTPDDFRYVLGLQERVSVGMADVYAQITRRPAVVKVHTAPGMGNAKGALYHAFVNKTPLIVTAGNQRRFMKPVLPADQHRPHDGA